MNHFARSLLLLFALLGLAGPLAAQIVQGQVLDASTAEPVEGAQVTIVHLGGNGSRTTLSDRIGRFELALPGGGRFSLEVDRLGYESYLTDPFRVEGGQTVKVVLQLGVGAIPLAPFLVLADDRAEMGRTADFERRRDDPTLGGHFLDAGDIQARPMATPSQLLVALPAVTVYQIQTMNNAFGLDRSLVYLPGGRGGSVRPGLCLAQMFVNGVPFRQSEDGRVSVDDLLDGAPIVGVELYTRASAAPIGYQGTGECGVVLYWTEEPTASSGSWSLKRIGVGIGLIAGLVVAAIVG
jgi:carboxypeptidase family protein